MPADQLLPLLTTLISLVFAAFVLDQYLSRRRPYQLVWTLALLIFGIASFGRFAGEVWGWDAWSFKLWYGAGAYGAAALLGMGTAYLLLPRELANFIFALLLAALFAASVGLASAPLNLSASIAPDGSVSGAGLPAGYRILSAPFNVFGTVFFVGGAVWSGLQFLGKTVTRRPGEPPSPWQYFPFGVLAFVWWCLVAVTWLIGGRRTTPDPQVVKFRNRALANLTIAGGGFVFAASGTLSKYFEVSEVLFLAEFVGTTIIFVGFLLSIEVFEQVRIPFTGVVLRRRRPTANAA